MHRGPTLKLSAPCVLLGVLFVFTWAPAALAADPPGTFRYTVKKGDSCGSIATDVYGEKRYDLMHLHTDLGPTPHHLKAGQVLVLPRAERQALVGHKVGPVRAAAPGRGWDDAYAGLDLYRRWRVNSMEHGFAEVVFKDDSSLSLRENTLLVIYGGTRSKARRERMRAELERGALRTRLGELAGEEVPDGGLEVSTAGSSALLGSGSALVSVDDTGATRVANHKGKPARVRSRKKAGADVEVSAGFGSKVESGRAPTRPKALPPSPSWSSSNATHFSAIQSHGAIFAQWTTVPQAATYRVELSRDPEGKNLVMAAEVPASKQGLALSKVPVGIWHLTVIAVDDDKFESVPSTPMTAEVLAVVIEDPVDGSALTMPREVWPGTRVRVPTGGKCRSGDAPAAEVLSLVSEGPHTVYCTSPDGDPLEAFQLTVRPAGLGIKPVAGEGVLWHNTRNRVRLIGAAPLLPFVTLESEYAATWPPTVDGEDLIVEVLVHADAPDEIELHGRIAGAPEPIGGWTLKVMAETEAPNRATRLPDVWTGLRAGRFVRSPRLGIEGGSLDKFAAPALGFRWNASERFILQAELQGGVVGIGPADQGPIATNLAWTVGVGWLGSSRPIRPLFEVGAGQYILVGHQAARLNAFYGTARAGLLAGPGPAVRLTINQDLLAGPSSGFATATGVTAGISFEY